MNSNLLNLIASAVDRAEHTCETDLTCLVARNLADDSNLRVWCSCSKAGKSRDLLSRSNVKGSFIAARSYDLAFGPLTSAKPTNLVQLKYDKGLHKLNTFHKKGYGINTTRNHALRDLIYMSTDSLRLRSDVDCHVISVVHKDNLDKDHRWKRFIDDSEWNFECEPSAISRTDKPRGGFLDPQDNLIRPCTLGQANEIFGTICQSLGYGFFARAGSLRVRFKSRSQAVGDFILIDWQLLDVSLSGTDLPLWEWLP